MIKQMMTNRAKQFYAAEIKADSSKRVGRLFIHNLLDQFGQEWIATFLDGSFIKIEKAKFNI